MSTHQTTAKRIANALLAAVLAIGLMVPTFALTATPAYAAGQITLDKDGAIPSDNTKWYGLGSITIGSNIKEAQYRVLQLFTGTASGSTGSLTNIEWGDSVTSKDSTAGETATAIINKLKADSVFGSGKDNLFYSATTAQEVASVLAGITGTDSAKKLAAFASDVVSVLGTATNTYNYVVSSECDTEMNEKHNGVTVYDGGVDKVHDGYYLLFEERDYTDSTVEDAVATSFILDVVNGANRTVYTKNNTNDETVPNAEKKVAINDSSTSDGDTAVKIGDTANFTITVTTPSDMSAYQRYSIVVTDTMTKGLTIDNSSVPTVTVKKSGDSSATAMTRYTGTASGTSIPLASDTTNNPDGASYFKLTGWDGNASDITLGTQTASGATTYKTPGSFKVDLGDVKQYGENATITITFTATVNNDIRANTSTTETTSNSVSLAYSNDPANPDEADGSLIPSIDDETKVTLNTAGLEVIKKDDSENRLSGASFAIYSDNSTTPVAYWKPVYTAVTGDYTAAGTTYVASKAKSGEYYFETTSGGYGRISNPSSTGATDAFIDPNESGYTNNTLKKTNVEYTIETTGGSESVTIWDGSSTGGTTTSAEATVTTVDRGSDGTYYKVSGGDHDGQYITKSAYAVLGTSAPSVEQWSGYTAYTREETLVETETTGEKTDKVGTSTNGVLRFEGLGAGTFYIRETVAPGSYKILDYDLKVVITYKGIDATTGEVSWSYDVSKVNQDSTHTAYTGTMNSSDNFTTLEYNDAGYPVFTIVNGEGGSLPTTGGIGTTIFYIVGGVLVAGAVVYLVTRRRMKAERE